MVQRFLSENIEGEDDPKASKLLANSDVFWGVAGNQRASLATEGRRDPWELAIAGVRKVAILEGDDCQGGGLLLYCAPSSGWRIATAQIFAVRWRKTLRMSDKKARPFR